MLDGRSRQGTRGHGGTSNDGSDPFNADYQDDGEHLDHVPENSSTGIDIPALQQKAAEFIQRKVLERMQVEHRYHYWRDSHRELWAKYVKGEDPGFEQSYAPGWARTEFDIQHLKEAMRRSTHLRELEDLIYESLKHAKNLKLKPFEWQATDFPDRVDDGYRDEDEAAMIDSAPVARITAWIDQLPSQETELSGPRRIADTDENPAQYPGEHIVEWNETMYEGLETKPDLEMWDSFSVRAGQRDKEYIRSACLGPPSQTRREEASKDVRDSVRLRSHYC